MWSARHAPLPQAALGVALVPTFTGTALLLDGYARGRIRRLHSLSDDCIVVLDVPTLRIRALVGLGARVRLSDHDTE